MSTGILTIADSENVPSASPKVAQRLRAIFSDIKGRYDDLLDMAISTKDFVKFFLGDEIEENDFLVLDDDACLLRIRGNVFLHVSLAGGFRKDDGGLSVVVKIVQGSREAESENGKNKIRYVILEETVSRCVLIKKLPVVYQNLRKLDFRSLDDLTAVFKPGIKAK